jgi:DNA-binding transcriptional regulator YiaG
VTEEEKLYGTLGAKIIASLEEAIRHARGEDVRARVTTVEVTGRRKKLIEQPHWYMPPLIREVRQRLGVTQAVFGQMLGVSASTVRAWEKGTREAEGPAARLLQLADRYPEVLRELCRPYDDASDDEPPLPRAIEAPARDRQRLAAERDAP